jgi:hypothetical protein
VKNYIWYRRNITSDIKEYGNWIPKEKIKETTGLLIPLKERDTRRILCVITNNTYKTLFPLTFKTDFNFLVCSGVSGIGT